MGLAAGVLAGFTTMEKKLAFFAKRTRNPYDDRIGDYVVKVCCQKDDFTIGEMLEGVVG